MNYRDDDTPLRILNILCFFIIFYFLTIYTKYVLHSMGKTNIILVENANYIPFIYWKCNVGRLVSQSDGWREFHTRHLLLYPLIN